MARDRWLVSVLLGASAFTWIANWLLIDSVIVGTVASIAFISLGSVVMGKLFYRQEHFRLQAVFGGATLLTVMAFLGTILILMAQFSTETALLVIALAAIILGLVYVRFGSKTSEESADDPAPSQGKKRDKRFYLLGLPFLFLVAIGFWLLWSSRTGEGMTSVWLAIPNWSFSIVFFLATFCLAVFAFFARVGSRVKLGLICLYSFLSHSLFWLVWYPGRYGDPWSHLGAVRYILKAGMPYAYSTMLEKGLWVDLVKYRAYQALVGFFQKMFFVDLYWVHVLFVPIMWSIFTSVAAYKIAETIAPEQRKVFPLLTAIATVSFSSLISWGTVSVPNSLGFIFFFLCTSLLLLWMNGAGRHIWFLAFLMSIVASLTHPQTGVFAFMLLFFVSVVEKTPRRVLRAVGFALLCVLYPLILFLNGASFSLLGLLNASSFLSFQAEIPTVLLPFALVGLIVGMKDRKIRVRPSLVLSVFYLVLLFEYYLTRYGMVNLPFGSGRILAMGDFLLVPFVAMGFLAVVDVVGKALWKERRFRLHLPPRIVNNGVSWFLVGLLLIGVFLSLRNTSVLFEAYPLVELVEVQPSVYDLEAISYIDTDAGGRYVVLCNPGFASLAIGFLGTDYGYAGGTRGMFGIPDFSYPTAQMYVHMAKNPSLGYMRESLDFANATVGYFVVSVREPDFEAIVNRVSEVLPVNAVFGNGRLYVFKYPISAHEELGEPVKVIFSNRSSAYIETKLVYMVENEINATLAVWGSTSYNVTEFPDYWTFLDLSVNSLPRRFDNSSDVNAFVYISGLEEDDVLIVKWLFNRHYTEVGWKEDSFRRTEWRPHELYGGTMVPTITKDGNVMTLSYSFTPGTYWYYYHTTSVNISTNDYPYIMIRWKANMPVAAAVVYFEAEKPLEIVSLCSQSSRWSISIVELPSKSVVKTVMVGLSNFKDQQLLGVGTMEVDFILLSARTTP